MLVPAEAKQDKTLPKKHESAEIILPPFAEHPESRKNQFSIIAIIII